MRPLLHLLHLASVALADASPSALLCGAVTRAVLEGGLPRGVLRVGDDCVDVSASRSLRGLLRGAVIQGTLHVVAPFAVDAGELFANASFADGARVELHAPFLVLADGIFDNATGFSQDVSDWNVSAMWISHNMFRSTALAAQVEPGTVACRIHAAWRQRILPGMWNLLVAGLTATVQTCWGVQLQPRYNWLEHYEICHQPTVDFLRGKNLGEIQGPCVRLGNVQNLDRAFTGFKGLPLDLSFTMSAATSLIGMFSSSNFNSNMDFFWTRRSPISLDQLFYEALSFNQPINSPQWTQVTSASDFLYMTAFNREVVLIADQLSNGKAMFRSARALNNRVHITAPIVDASDMFYGTRLNHEVVLQTASLVTVKNMFAFSSNLNKLPVHKKRVNPRLRTRMAIGSMSALASRRDAASCCCAAQLLCTSLQLEHARVLLAVDLVLPLGLGRLVRFPRLARLGAVLGAKRARLRLRGRGGTQG